MAENLSALATRFAKALSHPLRRQLLTAYSARVTSPSQVAAELGQPLGDVSYHTKQLVEHGCLELVRAEPGRGGVKHFYRARLEDPAWSGLAPVLRHVLADDGVEMAGERGEGAAPAPRDGRAPAREVELSVRLDREGRSALTMLLAGLAAEVEQLERESVDRGRTDELSPSVLMITHVSPT